MGIQRLIYSPKCWTFIKNQSGEIIDVSNYVTAGQVNRLVGQVSTAEVTLRNPNKIFTKPGIGQAFHPQDPITIFLQRLANQPVRVFTGFLDDTPYYQMYPGTIQLNASCTLKKLLYTFFDPSLPYVIKFFEKYGWFNSGSGSIISPYAAGSGATNDSADLSKVILNDASISKLLYAVMTDIGEWNDSRVYIEPIPSGPNGVAALMAHLMRSFQKEEASTQEEFTAFMNDVIGGAQGSGGGNTVTAQSTGQVNGIDQIVPQVKAIADKAGIPAELPLATMDIESNYGTNMHTPGTSYYGLFQMSITEPPYPDSSEVPTQADTYDLGIATGLFCNAAVYQLQKNPSLANNLQLWAETTQGVVQSIQQGHNQRYVTYWSTALANAKSYLTQYGSASSTVKVSKGNSQSNVNSNTGIFGNASLPTTDNLTSQRGFTDKKTNKSAASQATRLDDIESAANDIDKQNYPYSWGGGHGQLGVPTLGAPGESGGVVSTGPKVVGFDCSGAVSAVLGAAGILTSPQGTETLASAIASFAAPGPFLGSTGVNVFINPTVPNDHTFMQINGRYWGTSDDGSSPVNGAGVGWLPDAPPSSYLANFQTYHILPAALNTKHTSTYAGNTSVPDASGLNADGSSSIMSTSLATAFVSQLEVPTLEDTTEAIMLGQQHRGLLQDQNLLPFVQQMTQASLRNFMSLPNGDFYAFYPDYFGEFGHHNPYWLIDDIELLDGDIRLTDAYLATDVFAIGNTTWPANNQMINEIFSAGTVTIFNAFVSGTSGDQIVKANNGGDNSFINLMEKSEAVDFYKRYGARPFVQDYPMVRSPLFEMLMAYQLFCLAWSRQFISPFEFTFMPELYPGGKVGFPNHGIQMYIEDVTHTWDYEGGFTTVATLSAPAIMEGYSNPDLPPNMVAALVEPIRATAKPTKQHKAMTFSN
jgi:hypothetical protein